MELDATVIVVNKNILSAGKIFTQY